MEQPGQTVQLFDLPPETVLEVELVHPNLPWFAELGLRWHAVPAISNLPLRIGSLTYPMAPFNGRYRGTEIGSRNFADPDRYDMLTTVGERLGLPVDDDRSHWKDRGMAWHRTEERAGRAPRAEWSWVVPPMSATATPIYHQYFDEAVSLPGFLPPDPWTPPGKHAASR